MDSNMMMFLIVLGVVTFFTLLIVGLFVSIYFFNKPQTSPPPNTTIATSGGTVPDGTNYMHTYTGSYVGTSLTSPPTTDVSCVQVLNSNYVGYKIVNDSSSDQMLGVYGTYVDGTQCTGTPSIYGFPSMILAGTSIWWQDNLVNGTQFSLYYDCLLFINDNLGTSYYAVGDSNNLVNSINNTTQYLLINWDTDGILSFSVIDN